MLFLNSHQPPLPPDQVCMLNLVRELGSAACLGLLLNDRWNERKLRLSHPAIRKPTTLDWSYHEFWAWPGALSGLFRELALAAALAWTAYQMELEHKRIYHKS